MKAQNTCVKNFNKGCVLKASSAKPIKNANVAAIKMPTICKLNPLLGGNNSVKINENKKIR